METGPRLVERRRDLEENVKSKTKRELLQRYRGMRWRKSSRWFNPKKRSKEKERAVRGRRRREPGRTVQGEMFQLWWRSSTEGL